jgi:hypothetical protein
MTILQAQQQASAIQGIRIDDEAQILYQLFADDTGLFYEATESNFKAIMDCMAIYERISGAKVNLEKSTLVQLNSGPQPA